MNPHRGKMRIQTEDGRERKIKNSGKKYRGTDHEKHGIFHDANTTCTCTPTAEN